MQTDVRNYPWGNLYEVCLQHSAHRTVRIPILIRTASMRWTLPRDKLSCPIRTTLSQN